MSALENCEIISFSTDNLSVDESGAVALANRVFETFVEGELRNMNLFKGLPARVFAQVVPLFQLEEHGQADSSIFEEGDAGDKFYILLHGRVAVVKGDLTLAVLDSHAQDVHDGHPFFGEMALLDSAPRMAAIRTRTPCKMLVLKVRDFAKFLHLFKATGSDFAAALNRTKVLRQKQSELNVQSRTDNLNITAMSQIHTARSPEAQRALDEAAAAAAEGLAEAKAGIAEAERQAAATAIQAAARGRRTRNGRRKVRALERADVGLPEQA